METLTKTKWAIDATHSEVQFKIKHLMISTVTGNFQKFAAQVESEGDNFENIKISFTADADSISTGNEQRDGHLKSADFFDVAQFPHITFKATSYKKAGDAYELVGDLTLHGVTKSVKLGVEFGGIAKDGYGNTKAGFEVTGKINRKEFGLQWGALTEAGGAVVSDEVKIHAQIQLVKQ